MMNMIPITEICNFKKRKWLGFIRKNKLNPCLYNDIYNAFGVYCIWGNGKKGIESEAIYIGVTGSGKSIKKRLRTHIKKATGNAKYYPENWWRYKKSKPQIDGWTIGYKIFKKSQLAKAAEVALITHHIRRFGHAPICNNEYVEGMKYSEVIKSLKD